MQITQTPLAGLLVLQPKVFADERGWFMESFNQRAFDGAVGEAIGEPLDAPVQFVQDNHSQSAKGVLRGLHYQLAPHAQGKLVRVAQGAAWDVAVDIRSTSPTFGQWFGVELSATNHTQLWIPPGFAHGFVSLAADTHFLYKTTAYYDRASERCIQWNDATISIAWYTGDTLSTDIIISEKDAQGMTLEEAVRTASTF
jgi:dTDP-4-dehydrorhamnose 3,5-epimerase